VGDTPVLPDLAVRHPLHRDALDTQPLARGRDTKELALLIGAGRLAWFQGELARTNTLAEEAFAKAWQDGRMMSLAQAFKEAMGNGSWNKPDHKPRDP
jgi:hypothetical protein